jgi:hypothetical protein
MTMVGTPAEMIAQMRGAPMWPALEALAPSLAHDSAVMGDSRGASMPTERLAAVAVPTLVLDGGASPAWIREVARRVATTLPKGAAPLPGRPGPRRRSGGARARAGGVLRRLNRPAPPNPPCGCAHPRPQGPLGSSSGGGSRPGSPNIPARPLGNRPRTVNLGEGVLPGGAEVSRWRSPRARRGGRLGGLVGRRPPFPAAHRARAPRPGTPSGRRTR